MKVGMDIMACCWCPFNEHGQADYRVREYTYLGRTFWVKIKDILGPPCLYCIYDEKSNLRDNFRARSWRGVDESKMIWVAGDPEYKGEFDKQLSGFPDWCPLRKCEVK